MVAPPQHSPCPRVTSRVPAGLDPPPPGSALGDSPSAPIAPEQRHDLSPRKSSPLSLFSKNRLITKPSRLTLGAAAATVAAVAGISIGFATSSSTGSGLPTALNRAGAASAESHPGHPAAHAKMAQRAVLAHGAAPAAKPQHARAAHSVLPTKPYQMYDSVIPSALPANHAAAAYATGPYATSRSHVSSKGPVFWIDTMGSDPGASVLDVEPGDATPAIAATWARNRLSTRPHAVARIYTMISEWAAVKAAVAGLPHGMQSRIRWWIADPTGVAHLVPGSDATQWYWGTSYDISTATARF